MDSAQFKQVWIPLTPKFLAAAERILGDRAEAQDAVQDLVLKLWDRREALDAVGSPLSYGSAVLRNICTDRLRACKREGLKVRLDDGADLPGYPDETVAVPGIRELREAVGRLPGRQREVMEMRIFKGMEYKDIARATGQSELSLRVNLSLARKTLRKLWKK